MCYSAEVWADYNRYVEEYGAEVDIKEFVKLYLGRQGSFKWKIPKGMDLGFLNPKSEDERSIRDLIDQYDAKLVQESEADLFNQRRRLADAERKLAVKQTKTALNEQRIATNNIKKLKRWIADGKRSSHDPKDDRIFPDWYAPVLTFENGRYVVRPMRYHCRPAGMDPSIDRTKTGRISGTYNARRDNLNRFWRNQFGHTHGLMICSHFWEQVDDGQGGSMELKFTPRDRQDMLIGCLVSHWTDPSGELPDLWSYAAVTDDPEPEVAAAGHDRTIVNIKRENVEGWLRPDPKNKDALFEILDDKQHPFYENARVAA